MTDLLSNSPTISLIYFGTFDIWFDEMESIFIDLLLQIYKGISLILFLSAIKFYNFGISPMTEGIPWLLMMNQLVKSL